MRATARLADVSFNTVAKLLIDAGKVCADLHDVWCHVTASRSSAAVTYAKQKNVACKGRTRRSRGHLDLDRP